MGLTAVSCSNAQEPDELDRGGRVAGRSERLRARRALSPEGRRRKADRRSRAQGQEELRGERRPVAAPPPALPQGGSRRQNGGLPGREDQEGMHRPGWTVDRSRARDGFGKPLKLPTARG